jgi:hypothetical protein
MSSIDEASRSGDIARLNWWKNSGLELRYTDNTMDGASERGHIQVLVRRMVEEFWIRTKIHQLCHGWGKLERTYQST